MSATPRFRGQCHCGQIRFTVSDAVGVVVCHCRDCQQMHGNANAMVAADRAAVVFESDATLHWYASSDKARRGFCTQCGSRLFKDNLGSPKLMVSAGVIDPPTEMHIVRNLWVQSKGDWYSVEGPLPDA